MRALLCDRCGNAVPFDAQRCGACHTLLGYVPDQRAVRELVATADPVVYLLADGHRRLWRCLNAAWGCNWMLDATADGVWCRSCRLTRGRPDEARIDAMYAWMTAEDAKRRLVHQLDTLALPIQMRSAQAPDGLAFDLVHLPDEGAVTGHANGVVTLDLAETDARHRDDVRDQMNEHFRTIIGHLRHEIGHHYWNRLVGQSDDLTQFRRLFGDERADYEAALADHYATTSTDWDTDRFVTAYASSHPFEDWAETFAHYLHIVDVVDTADSYRVLPGSSSEPLDVVALELDEILERWQPINTAVNEIAACVGAPTVYPFVPSGAVIDKLGFVHRQVVAHSERGRFYAAH